MKKNLLLNWLELLVILVALWFIMSGVFELKFIIFGIGTCVVIACFCVNYLYLPGCLTNRQYFILHTNPFFFLAYFLWLMKEIVKSSFSVTWNVFSGRKSLQPHIVWFHADLDNPAARALLANSITLTPGTITVDIHEDGVYSVHALTKDSAAGLLDGTMQKKVARVFGEEIDFYPIDVEIAEEKPKETQLLSKTHTKKGTVAHI